MRYATIATGWITKSFTDAADKCGWEHIAQYSHSRGDDLSEFLSGSFETVYIGSPNFAHYEHITACLNAGKHVICEKPIVGTSAEYDELNVLADKKGLYLLEAYRHINSEGFRVLKRNLSKIGAVRNAILSYNQFSSKYEAFKSGQIANSFDGRHGGACYDLGVYPISFAVALWGRPQKFVHMSNILPNDADGTGAVVLKYDGFICNITYSKQTEGFTESEIMGESGAVVFDRTSELNNIRMKTKTSEEIIYSCNEPLKLLDEAVEFERIIRDNDTDTYMRLRNISRETLRIVEVIRGKA
jgi:predicted dehydrogenase